MSKAHPSLIVLAIILILSLLAIGKYIGKNNSGEEVIDEYKEAMYYEQLDGGRVQCNLCPNRCILEKGQRGDCKVRENIDGKLYSLVYGRPVTMNVDPIEKKPFFHVLPGAKAYSLATAGCNLKCKFCQNWDISQRFPEDIESLSYSPEELVSEAKSSGSQVIAFTYSEPTVFYEYVLDTAKLAREAGLKTVVVSSGYINLEPLRNLLPYLDAIKIDLKGIREDYYKEVVGGKLEPVLETLKIIKEEGTWLEIVNLLVSGYNDSDEDITDLCTWISENLSNDVPVHFSRFYPMYQFSNLPPTPEDTVKKARNICMRKGLKYVYTGNIEGDEGSSTYCPSSGEVMIRRKGYSIVEDHLGEEGYCQEEIPGVWK